MKWLVVYLQQPYTFLNTKQTHQYFRKIFHFAIPDYNIQKQHSQTLLPVYYTNGTYEMVYLEKTTH